MRAFPTSKEERYRWMFVVAIAFAVHLSVFEYGPHSDIDGERLGPRDTTRSTVWTPAESWTEDFRFTHNVHGFNISDQPAIASEGANVHVVFMNFQKDPTYEPYNRDLNIYYIRSTDGGRSWPAESNESAFIQLNGPAEDKFWGFAVTPTIAVSDSTVHVAWEQNPRGLVDGGRIRYRRSPDSGQTWINETIMTTENGSQHANLVANGSSVHLFWEEYNTSLANFFRPRIFHSRSLDKGATWEARGELAKSENVTSGCYVGSVAEYGQRIFLLYLCGDPPVAYFKRSLDNGETWEDGQGNANQSTTLIASTEEDEWFPVAISVWQDNVIAVFQRWIRAFSTLSHQLVSLTSNDSGETWSSPIVLVDHTDVPSYPGCFDTPPIFHDCGNFVRHPRVASEGQHLYMVWTDSRVEGVPNSEVFFMVSEDFGETWSPQYRLTEASETVYWPEIWASDGMIHVAWDDWRNDTSDVCYKRFPGFGSPPPSVVTIGAFSITDNNALLEGMLTNLGNYTLANVFFEWRVEGEANWTRLEVGKLYAVGDYEALLSNLSSGTTHEFRAGARTESEVFGDALNFTAITINAPASFGIDLEGLDDQDVLLSWNASANDPSLVSSYSIYYSWIYDREGKNYSFLAEIPANGSVAYSYVHEGKGHRDNSNYFYFVQANATHYAPARSGTQVVKFSKFLSVGIHLVSIPVIPPSKRIDDVLATVQFFKVWHYDSPTGWKSFSRLTPYRTDLVEINRTIGLWIDVVQDGSLTVVGTVPEVTTIHLHGGWNLIGFPSFDSSRTVRNLIEATGADRVEVLDPFAPPYYLRRAVDADALSAGRGYWVRVGMSTTWDVRN